MSEIRDVLERHRQRLMRIGGVVGVAVGRSSREGKKHCILVYTTTPERPAELPATLDGYDVEWQQTTGFRAL